jgi:CTP:molybdopterin cytidylyltransferase MocA
VVAVLGAAVVAVPQAQLFVVNNNWISGIGSSFRTGLAALPPAVRPVVVTLVDQPGIGEAARPTTHRRAPSAAPALSW